MKKCALIVLVVCLGQVYCPGQNTFEKKLYVGYDNRLSCQVHSLPDSSFLFLNYVVDSINGRQEIGLTKIDRYGNVLQNKIYNMDNQDYLVSKFGLQQFIEAGKSSFYLAGGQVWDNKFSVKMTRIDRFTFDTTKSALFKHTTWHYMMQDLLKLRDNKFLIAGTRANSVQTQPYILVLDSNLSLTHTVQVNTLEMLNTKAVYNQIKKKILLGGRFLRTTKYFYNIGLMEIDTLGAITNTYISSPVHSLVPAQIYFSGVDSTYVIIGSQVTLQYQSKILSKLNISKYDFNLKLLWRKSYGGEGIANGLAAGTILPDGSIVTVGCYGIYDSVDYNGVILKVDKGGDLQWIREYNNLKGKNTLAEDFAGLDQTFDGGFIVVGGVGFEPQGKAWVLKTDSAGCVVPGCASMSISVDSMLLDPEEPEEPVDTTGVSITDLYKKGVALDVFPNPAEELVVIRHGCGEALASRGSIRIFRVDGSLFKTIAPLSGTGANEVDMSAASRGIYLVQLLIDGKVVQSAKLVRE